MSASHLVNWVRPSEQKQIVRIILFAPMFAIFNFFAVYSYDNSYILVQFPQLYECFALVAMFYLLVLFVTPDEGNRETYFHHLQRLTRHTQKPKHERGSLRWFQVTWVLVFQILPSKLIISLVLWIAPAIECPLAWDGSKKNTAVSVLDSIATSVCVLAIIGFEKRLRGELKAHGPLKKLVTFKGFVGLVLIQTPIFDGIAQGKVFDRTRNVSVLDFVVGTPSFMVCVEMCIVLCLFVWSYSPRKYIQLKKTEPVKSGVFRGILDVLDIRDILNGCWYMTRIVLCGGMGKALMADQPVGKVVEDAYGPPAMVAPGPQTV